MKNDFIKLKFLFLIFLFFGVFGLVKFSWAATLTAVNCSQSEVQKQVTAAVRGDTVIVPAGSCIWTGKLNINKPITLQGAGIDKTIIKANWTPSGTWGDHLIGYSPSDPTVYADILMRITGFTLDANARTGAIILSNSSSPIVDQNKIRIDHNKILNCWGRTGIGYNMCIRVSGHVWGVADNNIFDGDSMIIMGGSAWSSWNQLSEYTHGSSKNFYFEDNVINKRCINPDITNHPACLIGDSPCSNDYWEQMFMGTHGGRYVVRYNDIAVTRWCSTSWAYIYDTHGNQGSGLLSTLGAEWYANEINIPDSKTIEMGNFRGGKCLAFNNLVTWPTVAGAKAYLRVIEDYPDILMSPKLKTICPAGTLYSGSYTCSPYGQPQHIWETYIWNNRKHVGTGAQTLQSLTNSIDPYGNGALALRENIDFWKDNSSCTGSVCDAGIGCGTLANRPTTCVAGAGYWETNQYQSCSVISNQSIGANPTDPIEGTLYRCTAPGTANPWTEYYKPYTYPHPLRGGTTNTAPSAPTGVRVI